MGRRTKKVGPARGFGSRYGATVRKRYVDILVKMRKPHKCPRCYSLKVRRRSVGIWECRKCGLTFAGGAYTPSTKLGTIARRATRGTPTPAA